MSPVPVRIFASRRLPPGRLLVSAGLARALSLHDGTPAAVRLGSGAVAGVLRVFPAPGLTLGLWPAAAAALHLPVPALLWARPGAAGGEPLIDVGPVVGILAAQYHSTYRLFVSMARRQGVLAYLFAPADVDWDGRVVLGRSIHRGRWVRRPFPFPHVVFDRSIGIGPPDTIAGFLAQMNAHGCTVFNGDLGDKWRMYQHLASYPELRRHLPETVLLESWDTVRAMLSRWGVVYVKPAAGFMGLGILRVAAAGHGVVRVAPSARFGAHVVPEAALAEQLVEALE